MVKGAQEGNIVVIIQGSCLVLEMFNSSVQFSSDWIHSSIHHLFGKKEQELKLQYFAWL